MEAGLTFKEFDGSAWRDPVTIASRWEPDAGMVGVVPATFFARDEGLVVSGLSFGGWVAGGQWCTFGVVEQNGVWTETTWEDEEQRCPDGSAGILQ